MPSLKDSLFLLHHPEKGENLSKIENFEHIAQQRLIIEELAAQQLSLLKIKVARKINSCNIFSINNSLTEQLLHSLDFQLTEAQSRCIEEINKDISTPQPMLRLLQGDVGSGKTIVYFERIKSGFANKSFEFKKSFCENVKKEMDIVINKELSNLDKGLNFLASVGSTAPFVGLFGTVWGIMNSFTAIGISQNTSLAVVAPGIAEALFATALGLVAAIPAVVAYNKISSDLSKYFISLETFIDEFTTIFFRQLENK